MKKLVAVLFAIVIIATVYLNFNRNKVIATYSVALSNLPERIRPRAPLVNTDTLIYQHLYYPMFERNENGQLKSKFLDMKTTRVENKNFTIFKYCLQAGLLYSDQSEILIDDLLSAIKNVHKHRLDLKVIKNTIIAANCASIELIESDATYYDKLTGLESTVIKSGTENNIIPIGYGPYQITHQQPDRIILNAVRGEVTGDFKRIEFIKIADKIENITEHIFDWNHMYHVKVPDQFREGFQKVDIPMMKVYFVLVKLQTKNERIAFAKCFDRESFIKELGLKLSSTSGFLPKSMPGANILYSDILNSFNDRNCNTMKKEKSSVIYPSYNADLHEAIRKYFQSMDEKLPVHVQVIPKTLTETIKIALSHASMINLVGSDTTEATVAGFMKNFIGKQSLIPKLPGFKEEVEAGSQANSPDEKERHLKNAHQLLLESGYVIPLGALIKTQYYPPNIVDVNFSNTVHGFPQIDRIRIQ